MVRRWRQAAAVVILASLIGTAIWSSCVADHDRPSAVERDRGK